MTDHFFPAVTPEIRQKIAALVERAFQEAVEKGSLPEAALPPVDLAPPRDPEHGDLASNIAMLLAGRLRRPPAAIASALAAVVSSWPEADR